MIGAIVGDIAGSRFEWHNIKTKEFEFLMRDCHFTDDTVMSLAVCDALMSCKTDHGDLPAQAIVCMQEYGVDYPDAGYGGRFRQWIAENNPQPYNSWGNGSAMRVSGCGYAATSVEEAIRLADMVTAVTHNHPEGMKGAEATAVAVFLARTGKNLLEIRDYINKNYYPINFTLDSIRDGYEFDVSCQGSVPQALEAFFESTCFEDAIRNAISIGGDSDTIAAITGAVAEAYYNAFRAKLNEPFHHDDRAYPLGPIATRSTLLDIYEKLVTNDPKGFLDEITENSTLYSAIILNNTENLNSELRDAFLDLRRVQGAPSYLFLLYLFKNKETLAVDDGSILKITRLLINFFIRRNLTDTPPTRDLTRLFMTYIEEIEQNAYTGEALYANLRNKLLSVSASDEFFAEKLHGPVYDENSGACRFILCMIAKQGMTQETYVDLWRQNDNKQFVWSIEHIFPQGNNIPQPWVDMIAGGDRTKAQEYQSLYVHTFGNLTITAYNSTLSNKSFEEKRDRKDNSGKYIGYRNGLNLNADVFDKESWTVEIIKERTDKMVKTIMEMSRL